MASCSPSWLAKYRAIDASGKQTIASGCTTSGGNVQCAPEAMRAHAEQVLGQPISLAAYTLARYMTSEVGSGPLEERIAVGAAAINRAKRWKLPQGVVSLLLLRQKEGHPNRGFYGPIHGSSGTSTAPYGRWAATSKDPTVANVRIAEGLLSGELIGFAQGADDQDGLEYFQDPEREIHKEAASGSYWIGPLPNVNPWHTFLWREMPTVTASSAAGQALVQRALDYVGQREKVGSKWRSTLPMPTWSDSAACKVVTAATSKKGLWLILGATALGGAAWWFTRRRPLALP